MEQYTRTWLRLATWRALPCMLPSSGAARDDQPALHRLHMLPLHATSLPI